MNRTTARLVAVSAAAAGAGALAGVAAGAAQAATPDGGPALTPTAPTSSASDTGAPNYVLHEAPGLPIGNPAAHVWDVAAPAYGVLGALG